MKPTLSLEMLLGVAPPQRGATPPPAAADDLDHRLLRIVWANGEGLDSVAPTRGTALLQHGFKEWSGALGVTVLPTRGDTGALPQVLQSCDSDNVTPLVLCRDLDAPLQALAWMRSEACAVLAVGAPSCWRLNGSKPDTRRGAYALPLPSGVDPRGCHWLGAPPSATLWAVAGARGLRVGDSELRGGAAAHLERLESQLCRETPEKLWCVVFLDDIDLDTGGTRQHPGLAPEALAATLRWLQRQVPWVAVFMVSHERVTAPQRHAVAELARHLGSALHRHRGARREPFPAVKVQNV